MWQTRPDLPVKSSEIRQFAKRHKLQLLDGESIKLTAESTDFFVPLITRFIEEIYEAAFDRFPLGPGEEHPIEEMDRLAAENDEFDPRE